MTLLDIVAYAASIWIVVVYFLLAHKGPQFARRFHWANALGAIPVLATEVIAHAYPPMVLTVSFGTIGFLGLLHREDLPNA